MKKLLYIYSIALIILLIGCSFLTSDETRFPIFAYSIIIGVIFLNDFSVKGYSKELIFDLVLIIIFTLFIVFVVKEVSYEIIIVGIFPLCISLYRTVTKIK